MRQETRTLYTAAELKEEWPDSFERAHRDFCENQTEINWSEEIIESLKGVFEYSNIKLLDYEIDGICGYSNLKFDMDENVRELSGKRAFAWLENNLISKLRIPYAPISINAKRREFTKYGDGYRPGQVKCCPFTGYCADEDFLDALKKSVKDGDTIGEAFKNLANVAGKLRATENDYQQTEEYFLDHAEANGYEYSENGELV